MFPAIASLVGAAGAEYIGMVTMAYASRKTVQFLIILASLLCLIANPAIAAKRVALVIGNSNYQNTSSLKNPVNDAELMAKSLTNAGFEVTKILDADYRTLKRSLLEFGRSLYNNPEAGLFYYAGHGVQVRGENYLIPVNAKIDNEDEIDFEAIPVNNFLRVMNSSTSNINIVVLDACRNNPFARSFRSASRGLAPVDAPKGTYIAYATAPGDVAADGKGKNSPYTIALTDAMKGRGITIEKVFKNARETVLEKTASKQVPWETSSITGEFYFLKQEKIVAKKTIERTNRTNGQIVTSQAERAFGLIQNSENLSLLNAFVKKYPDSFHASIISARIEELTTRKIRVESDKQKAISEPGIHQRLEKLKEAEKKWALLKTTKDIGALKQFAEDYADTAFGNIALSRFELLGELALLEEKKKQSSSNALRSGEARIQAASDRWKKLKNSRNLIDLTRFAEEYPELAYANLAIARTDELRIAIRKKQETEAKRELEGKAKREWAGLKNSHNQQKIRRFSTEYSNTSYAALATNRIFYLNSDAGRAEAKWQSIKWSRDRSDLISFIKEFPKSTQTKWASNRIGTLAESEANKKFDAKAYKQAFRLYKQAFDRGNKSAAFRLAYLYAGGRGVKRNSKEAARLYKLVLQQNKNNSAALHNLAVHYENGTGVRMNNKEAALLVYRALRLKNDFSFEQMTTNKKAWNKEFRRELQRKMKKEGYYKGAIDGSFGPATIAAMKKVSGK